MDKKLIGLVAIFMLFFGAFLSFLLFDKSNGPKTLRAAQCEPDSRQSHLFVYPLEVKADSTEQSTVSVFVRDISGQPCSGKTVSISTTTGQIAPQTSLSDENGKTNFVYTCDTPGISQLQAIVNGSLTVEQGVTIKCS